MRVRDGVRLLLVPAIVIGPFWVGDVGGQTLEITEGSVTMDLTVRDDDELSEASLYSGDGQPSGGGTAPQLAFEMNGGFGAINFFPSSLSLPSRFQLNVEAMHLIPDIENEFVVRALINGLVLASDNPSQRYLADADDDEALANHIWYENKVGAPGDPVDHRMMQLTQADGGTLLVDGPVTQNHTFDIAETFWESEAIEPGELVAIDPDRPNGVVRTSGAYQGTLLGVASTRPGFILGGGAFSLAELAGTWGPEIADEYQRERPARELEVYAELPELQAAAARLASPGSFEAHFVRARSEREAGAATAGQTTMRSSSMPSPARLAAAYAAALHDHETTMFDLTLRRFFRDRFSAVALAGRVPVKVDASFGAIAPGDYLTASPIPGVAMKATEPGPVIGTALEAHSAGSGAIEVFVHRCWYGGGGTTVGGVAAAAVHDARSDGVDREITLLRERLALLEDRLQQLTGEAVALGERIASP